MRHQCLRVPFLSEIVSPLCFHDGMVPHSLHPLERVLVNTRQRHTIRPQALHENTTLASKTWPDDAREVKLRNFTRHSETARAKSNRQLTQSTGQKKASAILNPPHRKPSSASPSTSSRFFVAARVRLQSASSLLTSLAIASLNGTPGPVKCATKLHGYASRSAAKPECIAAAAERALARRRESAGQRCLSGCCSARNSHMASESWMRRVSSSAAAKPGAGAGVGVEVTSRTGRILSSAGGERFVKL